MSFTKTPLKPTCAPKWPVPMRPHLGTGAMEYYLEGELKARFCRLYPKNSNFRLMQWFGLSASTVQRFKREFGLEKDMKAIRKQLASDVKKICEANGYYASLRGHAMPDACRAAAKELWAEGFHPMKQLRASNPRKYKRVLKKRSERRKALFSKERLRMAYGLERKTRLLIPLNNLTHNASSHKHLMIKQCNYFADPLGDSHIVCYDSETRRSARREATAAKHGLKVVEADE